MRNIAGVREGLKTVIQIRRSVAFQITMQYFAYTDTPEGKMSQ